ncbi:MAG: fructokinase [Abditibacteriota bacterium]|nr:fructokinase [Abditibacteriota bacterium]
MARAVCFGELLVDMVSDADAGLSGSQRFYKAPGGAPANVAVGLARLGVSSSFVGQVGDDPFGHWLLDTLATENVETKYLRQSEDARTTIAFVATRTDGKKDICFYRNPGADAQYSESDFDVRVLSSAQVFHCGSVSLSLEPCRSAQLAAVQEARERGLLISYDPNWRPSLWSDLGEAHRHVWSMMALSDIVKVSDEEWEFVTGEKEFGAGAAKIRALGPQLVIITRGENGAYFNCGDAEGEVAGFHTKAIDTLGAGDAFVAGTLCRILEAPSLQSTLNATLLNEIMRFANACGALATLQSGGIPSLPTRAEVEMFLQEQG